MPFESTRIDLPIVAFAAVARAAAADDGDALEELDDELVALLELLVLLDVFESDEQAATSRTAPMNRMHARFMCSPTARPPVGIAERPKSSVWAPAAGGGRWLFGLFRVRRAGGESGGAR